jgi:phosphohistidine swiveling domain-containing protein
VESRPAPDDPLHWKGPPPGSAWTTVNVTEALPDVPTPLTWSFFSQGIDGAFFGGFHALGALSKAEYRAGRAPEDRSCAIFFGRPALNVTQFRAMAARMPMTSGDAMEEQLFGRVRIGGDGGDTRARYPVIAGKLPFAMATAPYRLRRAHTGVAAWRRAAVGRPIEPGGARAVLAEALRRFCAAFELHTLGTMSAQGQYEQLKNAAARAGLPGLETRLVSGYGSLVELDLILDLWGLSRGHLPMTDFLLRHGDHGPYESELSSLSWRENPAPVEALARRYRESAEAAGPRASFERGQVVRQRAEARLMGATPRVHRPAVAATLRLARVFVPCRELGKATFLQAVDVARAAARVLGDELTRTGVLAEPEDVFHLTTTELLGTPPGDVPGVVAYRREQRERYRAMELPEVWTGLPEPVHRAAGRAGEDEGEVALTGLAVSCGDVEGVAVVVTDPGGLADLPADAVLVCAATDPSWAPLLFQSIAVVIDVGGQLSHGAIVARELGVPCVINTRDAVRRISSGDRVRVNGDAGTVRVLKHAT